jgi:HrpA-like RNA helicase
MIVAQRVAHGCALGTTVGNRVRFDACSTIRTTALFRYDGWIFLTQSNAVSFILSYAVIVLAEAQR